jgi:hypothetical protein
LSCETPVNSEIPNAGAINTGTPEIKKVLVSDSLSNLSNGIEVDSFAVGGPVYFGLTITDTDLDSDKIVILQKSASQNIDPVEITIPVQVRDTDFYYGYMAAEIPETWTIEGYVVDKQGNKSNTVIKNIIVNDMQPELTYTVTYDLNGGTGTVPVDNNTYRKYDKVITKNI